MIALLLALYGSIITLIGCLELMFLWISLHILSQTFSGIKHILMFVIVFTICILLKLHMLPGFNNWMIANNYQLSANSVPHNYYINFDSTIIGILLGFYFIRDKLQITSLISAFKNIKFLMFITSVLLLGFAHAFRLISLDLKYNNIFPLWAIINLISVCISEEVLFRGFLIKELSMYFNKYTALIISAIGFGLMHYTLGWEFIYIATIAGICYGLIYLRTSKIEISILVHFMVNTIHFLFFSYPKLI